MNLYSVATIYPLLNEAQQTEAYDQIIELKKALKLHNLPFNRKGTTKLERLGYKRLVFQSMKAIDKLYKSNQQAVIRVAHSYSDKGEVDDLISAGNEGINRAIVKFNPNKPILPKNPLWEPFQTILDSGHKKIKFSSYAWFWILEAVRREVYKKPLIPVPQKEVNNYFYTFTSGQKLADEEICDIFDTEDFTPTKSLFDDVTEHLSDEDFNMLIQCFEIDSKRGELEKMMMYGMDYRDKVVSLVDRLHREVKTA